MACVCKADLLDLAHPTAVQTCICQRATCIWTLDATVATFISETTHGQERSDARLLPGVRESCFVPGLQNDKLRKLEAEHAAAELVKQ